MTDTTAALAAQINRFHALTAKDFVRNGAKAGELLDRVRNSLPRGSFENWVKANCNFGISTAYRYLKCFELVSQGVEVDSLSSVYGRRASGRSKSASPRPWNCMQAHERIGRAIIREFTHYGASREHDGPMIAHSLRQHAEDFDVMEGEVHVEREIHDEPEMLPAMAALPERHE